MSILQLPPNNPVAEMKALIDFIEEYEERKKAKEKEKQGKKQHNFTFMEHLVLTFFFSLPVGLISAYCTVIMLKLR